METFSMLLAICAGNSPVTGEFPTQRPVTRSFDVFFDLRLNKRLSKQSWGWFFETLSCPFWRHCNGKFDPWISMTFPCLSIHKEVLIQACSRRVTHSPTLGKYKAHLVICTLKCPFWQSWPIIIYWKSFLVGRRHVSVSFYVCETTPCTSDVLPERTDWHYFYNPYPVETGAAVIKFHFSLNVKATYRRHAT